MNIFKKPIKFKLNQNTEGSIFYYDESFTFKLIEQFQFRLDIKLYANLGSPFDTWLASPLFTQLWVRIHNELANELRKSN